MKNIQGLFSLIKLWFDDAKTSISSFTSFAYKARLEKKVRKQELDDIVYHQTKDEEKALEQAKVVLEEANRKYLTANKNAVKAKKSVRKSQGLLQKQAKQAKRSDPAYKGWIDHILSVIASLAKVIFVIAVFIGICYLVYFYVIPFGIWLVKWIWVNVIILIWDKLWQLLAYLYSLNWIAIGKWTGIGIATIVVLFLMFKYIIPWLRDRDWYRLRLSIARMGDSTKRLILIGLIVALIVIALLGVVLNKFYLSLWAVTALMAVMTWVYRSVIYGSLTFLVFVAGVITFMQYWR